MFVRDGAVTPGPSRECDITFFVKRRPKSVKPRSLQCGFLPLNPQILIWILLWIFGWIFSLCFSQGKWPPKNHQKIPRKIHPEFWSEKFPSDFCRSLWKSARQSRDSTVAAHRVQSVTVPSSWVSRECRSPGLRPPPLKMPDQNRQESFFFADFQQILGCLSEVQVSGLSNILPPTRQRFQLAAAQIIAVSVAISTLNVGRLSFKEAICLWFPWRSAISSLAMPSKI